jgi:hypothetical protein
MNTKAARLGLNGRVTATDLGLIFLYSDGVCPYCGIGITTADCSFDHKLPFDGGGDNTTDNIVACCLTDQRQKARRLVSDYAAARAHRANCIICGREFKPRWADVRRGFGQTCSAKCAGTYGRRVRSQLFAARHG